MNFSNVIAVVRRVIIGYFKRVKIKITRDIPFTYLSL